MTETSERRRYRKQITFDLSQAALKRFYPRPEKTVNPLYYKRAYADISRFMKQNGFEHRRFSVYTSRDKLTVAQVVSLIKELAAQMPWLSRCVNQIDVTNIGAQHSLLQALERAAAETVLSQEEDKSRGRGVEPESAPSPRRSFHELANEARTEADRRSGEKTAPVPTHEKQER